MKIRLFTSVLAAAMTLSVCGCAQNNAEDKGIKIVTTVFPSYDFAREIGGENAQVSLLLTPGAESHSFEPTATDVLEIQQCDVFVYVGGTTEQWVEEVLGNLNTEKIEVIRLFDYVEPLCEEEHEHNHETEAHDHDEEYDEHIWTSPKNAVVMCKTITGAMTKADAENAAAFEKNSADYIKKLEKLDQDYRSAVDSAGYRTLIFGDRFPFRYLVQEYGLDYHAAFSGCSSETEASAATLSFLIDTVKAERVPLVLYTESSTQKIAERICEATGADSAMLHSCNNITKQESADGVTYLSLMEQNLDVLKRALSAAGEETP